MEKNSDKGYVETVEAYLPYFSEAGEGVTLSIDGARRLTVLLGRNASGKTMLLETIGYGLAVLAGSERAAKALGLVPRLRPRRQLPVLLSARLKIAQNSALGTVLIDVTDPSQTRKHLTNLKNISQKNILLADTINIEIIIRYTKHLSEYFEKLLNKLKLSYTTNAVVEFFSEAFQDQELSSCANYDIFTLMPSGSIKRGLKPLIERRRLKQPKAFHAGFLVNGQRVELRLLIIRFYRNIDIVAAAEKSCTTYTSSETLIYYPGFVYQPSSFEELYYSYARDTGVPREQKAIELLKGFIPWFNGFELLRSELHVKTRDGRRVSVYSLSDGQRAAVFLGLLYALSPSDSVFLIDTPEAFVHPDGINAVAEAVAGIAASGSQVFVATQSIEFLKSLLESAKRRDILEDTVVKHLRLAEGKVSVKGSWGGAEALGIIDELGIDLRRA